MSDFLYATIDAEVGHLELISLQSVGDLELISLDLQIVTDLFKTKTISRSLVKQLPILFFKQKEKKTLLQQFGKRAP